MVLLQRDLPLRDHARSNLRAPRVQRNPHVHAEILGGLAGIRDRAPVELLIAMGEVHPDDIHPLGDEAVDGLVGLGVGADGADDLVGTERGLGVAVDVELRVVLGLRFRGHRKGHGRWG